MAKKILNKTQKQDILNICKKIILENNPELNDREVVNKQKEEFVEKLQKFVDEKFNYPKEVKDFADKYKLWTDCHFWAKCYVISYLDGKYLIEEELKIKAIQGILCYNFDIENPFVSNDTSSGYRKLENLFDVCQQAIKQFNQDVEKISNNLKEQFEEIFKNFKNIVYSLKYVEDVANYFDNKEIQDYCEKLLNSQCTTLSCINNENIDFVKNYLQAVNKKVDNEEK